MAVAATMAPSFGVAMDLPRIAGLVVAAGLAIVVIAGLFLATRVPAPGASVVPGASVAPASSVAPDRSAALVTLPSPMLHGDMSLEEVLAARRSVREFGTAALTDAQIGQLLWAAQGITGPDGKRTAPSAGGTYPLELLAITASGVRRYLPELHALRPVGFSDVRHALSDAASGQAFVAEAPLVVVVAAVSSRTEARYGTRAEQYVMLEAGHATQNLLLEAVALGLAGVPVGAFDEAAVARVLGLDQGERALYLVPIGHPRR